MLRDLERAVEATLLDRLVAGTGVDTERIRAWQRFDLEAVTVSDEGESAGGFEAAFFSTVALSMLLYMAVLINGQGMAMAIVEEKSSRLIEVILGAVTSTEFMAGKILGVLGSGLTQLGIWVAAVLLGVFYAAPMLSLGAGVAEFDLGAILSLELIFYFSVFFTLGYFLYSVFFAVLAATCTSTEELGHAMFAAVVPMVIALMSTFYVIANPGTRRDPGAEPAAAVDPARHAGPRERAEPAPSGRSGWASRCLRWASSPPAGLAARILPLRPAAARQAADAARGC